MKSSARSLAVVALMLGIVAIIALGMMSPRLNMLVDEGPLPEPQTRQSIFVGTVEKAALEALLTEFADAREMTLADSLRLPHRAMMTFGDENSYLKANNVTVASCLEVAVYHKDIPAESERIAAALQTAITSSLRISTDENADGCATQPAGQSE